MMDWTVALLFKSDVVQLDLFREDQEIRRTGQARTGAVSSTDHGASAPESSLDGSNDAPLVGAAIVADRARRPDRRHTIDDERIKSRLDRVVERGPALR